MKRLLLASVVLLACLTQTQAQTNTLTNTSTGQPYKAGDTLHAQDLNTAFSKKADYPIAIPTNAWNLLGGYATGVNFNSVGDTPITITTPAGGSGNYIIEGIWIYNTGTTANPSTARYGLFSAPSGGGTSFITNTPLGVTGTGLNTVGNMFVNAPNTPVVNYKILYFRITTPQGAASSGNVYITFHPVP